MSFHRLQCFLSQVTVFHRLKVIIVISYMQDCLVTYTFSFYKIFLSQVTHFACHSLHNVSVIRLQCVLSQVTMCLVTGYSVSSHRLHVFLVKGYNLTVFNGNTVPVHL